MTKDAIKKAVQRCIAFELESGEPLKDVELEDDDDGSHYDEAEAYLQLLLAAMRKGKVTF